MRLSYGLDMVVGDEVGFVFFALARLIDAAALWALAIQERERAKEEGAYLGVQDS